MPIDKRSFPMVMLALLVVALVFVSCGDSDEPTESVDPLAGAALCLSDSSCAMGAVCDTSSAIDVTNCGNRAVLSWTAATDAAWVTLSVAGGETPGELCLMTDSNCTGAERVATVTVTAEDLTDELVTIDVTQPSTASALLVSLSEWEAYCLGEESEAISVENPGNDVSITWTVDSDEDWLTLSATSGSTPGSFTITADANQTNEPRTGTVTVTADGAADSPWQITVDQPAVIALTGSCVTPGYGRDVYVLGDYAYVADGDEGLRIIDVSDPSSPTPAGNCDTQDDARGVFVLGGYAFVADGSGGLQIVDVSDPENPTPAGNCDTEDYALAVFVSGDYAYVGDEMGLGIIDVSDPENPAPAGYWDTDDYAMGVYVVGDYAYVACYTYGLKIIDVFDPENPTLAGQSATGYDASGVIVLGDYAYLAGYTVDLQIEDVSDPYSQSLAGNYATANNTNGVFVSGDYAFVAIEQGGLQIIDVSDPTNPALAGSYGTPGSAQNVVVSGSYAYVADGSLGGLLILKLGL
jgi:hypothetical protein